MAVEDVPCPVCALSQGLKIGQHRNLETGRAVHRLQCQNLRCLALYEVENESQPAPFQQEVAPPQAVSPENLVAGGGFGFEVAHEEITADEWRRRIMGE